jgi:hypothetical protein
MSVLAQAVLGFGLAVAGWSLPRWVAKAKRLSPATLLDAAPFAVVAFVLLTASGRPVFAGTVVFVLGAGMAFVDRTMRDVLREPIVFTALSELPQVFTHPHLYLPFAGTGLVLGGAAAALFGAACLFLAEPAAMSPMPLAATAVSVAVAALLWRLGGEPWLSFAAGALRRLRPSGEPFADAARLGPIAMLIVHGIVARAERPARRATLAMPAIGGDVLAARPIILVQCESFFDARRALPSLSRDLLAGYDAACASGVSGQLVVPAWGANTMRAEFAVLTGIDDAALGYDRFNPYHALARGRIPSQVWRLREAGYRTICLHPFDRRFFRRDLAMPALGFDMFLGRETLGGDRTPPYLPDPQLADCILRVLDAEGPRTFIFAITMGNHGPWFDNGCDEWATYLDGLKRSDEMLQALMAGLSRRGSDAVLGFYGDHLPSLPRVFERLGFDDWRSDYVIWAAAGGIAQCRDLVAHDLGRSIVDIAFAQRNTAAFATVVPEPHDA